MLKKKPMSDAEVASTFHKYYMQRVTVEFEDDLDKIRGEKDFTDGALPTLVHALEQGTSIFLPEDQRRIVIAGEH